MFPYIAPTRTLLLAVVVYREPFTASHALGFGLVWVGLGLFTSDSIRRAGDARATRKPMRNFPAATSPTQGNPVVPLAANAVLPEEE